MSTSNAAVQHPVAVSASGPREAGEVDLAPAFAAEDMLSAPRPQVPIISPDKRGAINVVDQWDPKKDEMTRKVYFLQLNEGHSLVASPDTAQAILTTQPKNAGSFFWLDDSHIGYLRENDVLSLDLNPSYDATAATGIHQVVDDADDKGKEGESGGDKGTEGEVILSIPKGVNPSGLRYHHETRQLVFAGQVWEGSGVEDVEKREKEYEERGFDAEVYDELFIRHWDTWRLPGKVWTVIAVELDSTARHEAAKPVFKDLLKGTEHYQKMDAPSFILSPSHIAITIKPPHLNDAIHTRTDILILPMSSRSNDQVEIKLVTPHKHGAISGATFDRKGEQIAWLEMAQDGYESDRNVVKVARLEKGSWEKVETKSDWDRSPEVLTWSHDGRSLFLAAQQHGRVLPFHITDLTSTPSLIPFADPHAISAMQPLSKDTLLISQTSLLSPSDSFAYHIAKNSTERLTDWSSKHIGGRLDAHAPEEFWFEGSEGWKVMAWVLKPRGWKKGAKTKSFPMALLIHGGPQGAWEDAWSTRWNPALMAAQGYLIVAVNPIGSTGYGQEFTDRIQNEWGSRPFKDLLAGYHAALKAFPEIDPERTAALGGSYGGYMANWIQGHNSQFGFKALVCHDGMFDTATSYYTTEELWFPGHEFNGDPTQTMQTYQKWNPMNHVAEWSTPQLIIHGGKDFRLDQTHGIAAFTALQKQGVPSRFVYFPNENHWVLAPKNSRKWHHEVFRWLDEWIGENVQ